MTIKKYLTDINVDAVEINSTPVASNHAVPRSFAIDRINHTGTQNMSTIVPNSTIGTPTDIDDLNEIFNHVYSSGIAEKGVGITDNGNGTVDITAGQCFIRATDSSHVEIIPASYPAISSLALTDNSINFLYVDYNGGSLIQGVTTDPSTINLTTRIPSYLIVREGTSLTIFNVGEDSIDANAKLRQRLFYTESFVRSDGGATISNPSLLYLACSAGGFWFGLQLATLSAIDTSVTGTFEYYYTADSGASWVESDETQLSNTQYNDITSGLVSLSTNKFYNNWVYSVMSTEGSTHYAVVYGQAEYNSLAEAADESPPSVVPPSISGLGVLLGVITIKKSATTAEEVRSAFTTSFNSAQVTSHTELSDIGTNTHAQLDTFVAKEGTANGLATLDATTKIPTAQNGDGTPDSTKFLRGDRTWAVPTDLGAGIGSLPFWDSTGAKDDIDLVAATALTTLHVTSEFSMDATADFRVGGAFGWRDLFGAIVTNNSQNAPDWTNFRDGLYMYSAPSNKVKEWFLSFHIDHDYAIGTKAYPHIHLSVNTVSSGVIRIGIEYSVAKGHQQATGSVFGATTTVYVEATVTGGTDQYKHFVLEVSDLDAIPSTLLEPDSIILIRMFNDSTDPNYTYADDIFLIQADVHYQIGKFATPNKAPDFYA